ncbi:zinc finger BED domain-containing protein 5 [Trichonephila clavipes]|nr:zinc finger BED domain-containing protein 5 [Trichonephila clavipes]
MPIPLGYRGRLVIVRYPYENSFEEDMLMCSPLPTNTTGEEIFNKINIFFEENNLSWSDCIDVCTDGAKAMTGNTAGLVSRIKIKAPNCSSSHCILHRQAPAMKQMPSNLKLVMEEAVKIILSNHDRYNPDCTIEDYGSKHKTLLLHTEVRWLSRGKTLTRLFELRAELQMFLSDTSFNLKDRLYDIPWLFRLSFMADIFQKLNELNLSLQEMSSDTSMKPLFKTTPLNDFWCRIRDEYPMLGKMALNILLPFPTTYLCETGFSTYAATKTKYRKRLDAEPDMRLQLSSVKPDINLLMKNKKQFHIIYYSFLISSVIILGFRQVFRFPKGFRHQKRLRTAAVRYPTTFATVILKKRING